MVRVSLKGELIMVTEVKIKKGSYGMVYSFTFESVDYSGYSAKLYVWKDSTLLINGGTCSVTLSGSDTLVKYTVKKTDFVDAETADYNAEVQFYSGETFLDSRVTFTVKVEKTAPTT